MNCDDFRDDFELYALGLLDDEERVRLETHLGTGCERCGKALSNAMTLNAAILAGAAQQEPSRGLRNKVATTLTGRASAPRLQWAWAALTAIAVITATSFFAQVLEKDRQLAEARALLEGSQLDAARVSNALNLLSDPATRKASVAQSTANYFINAQRGVLLIASNLRPVAQGRTYQMWVLPKGKAPQPAGLFQAAQRGSTIHLFMGPVNLLDTEAFAVSEEPDSGSSAPTTTPQLIAPLPAGAE